MKWHDDTIVASATPPGRGGVAIVRISGPLTQKIATVLLTELPKARYAVFTPFFDQEEQAIDEGIALFFLHHIHSPAKMFWNYKAMAALMWSIV